ncbi:hypothetical protein F909_02547 [Acinetobacter sp. ANC 3929]|uniref:hypothetical protein n=1 Tax=unclassified Acinetobacter TaxID=196816 RepID=UPI0002CDE528|nr:MULTISPECIES: hypothetical protein [unclassified Acinetobacter]ENW81256.1 hypothetical protein F909_02547 [Acinetobacter sp. ANC 3929]MCH7352340.1 hypothetical protein [Acinetobacter sp. NIPH 2023]MCH7356542.1 hypothetical protein [Acinetobacter sp. NIPH 1958]MCH7358307.1 hypothetical protein [Acinetobacter sp. NIPH 2024]
MVRSELIYCIEQFLDKKDISKKNANNIEFLLENLELKQEFVDNIILMLASYAPGGGEYMYNEDQVANELKKLLKNL